MRFRDFGYRLGAISAHDTGSSTRRVSGARGHLDLVTIELIEL